MSDRTSILAIGAHAADMEISAGAVLAKCASQGGEITLLHLTLGERGHPKLDPDAYAAQKRTEAEEAAKELGGRAIFFPYKDGELPDTEEVRYQVCDVIREVKPTVILSHWKNSIHKDHAAAHRIVEDAVFYAAIPGIVRTLPNHRGASLYYTENWEDPEGFTPYYHMDITGFTETWERAARRYELFSGTISSFPYLDYYRSLARIRGALSGVEFACAFDISAFGKKRRVDMLP